MAIQLQQALEVGKYLVTQRLLGRKRFPLVLMLEPLFRCNLACPGCGKIQHPTNVLKQHLTPEQCFAAAEECGAPIVSIPGGEPLLHPQIAEIVQGLVERKKFIYLCTNGVALNSLGLEYLGGCCLTPEVAQTSRNQKKPPKNTGDTTLGSVG